MTAFSGIRCNGNVSGLIYTRYGGEQFMRFPVRAVSNDVGFTSTVG